MIPGRGFLALFCLGVLGCHNATHAESEPRPTRFTVVRSLENILRYHEIPPSRLADAAVEAWRKASATAVTTSDPLYPPGHEYYTMSDAALAVREIVGPREERPRLLVYVRSDVWRNTGRAGRCLPGTLSFAASSGGKTCSWGRVPMCHGGARDEEWCRCDLSDKGCTDHSDCPGGTCTAVPFDFHWLLRIGRAAHAKDVSRYRNAIDINPQTVSYDSICDGVAKGGERSCDPAPDGSIGKAFRTRREAGVLRPFQRDTRWIATLPDIRSRRRRETAGGPSLDARPTLPVAL